MNLIPRPAVGLLGVILSILPAIGVMSQTTSISNMKKSASEATLPVVVLPSPNSASLTRSVSENVDLYTGMLSIDVPLYTLKSRQIEIPISLQTTANAHRVNEIGS